MRISRLQIQNFRSIADADIPLPQVAALVGPNNAGKSNLLLAIKRVLARDWVNVRDFSENDVRGRDPDADVRIVATFDPPIPYEKYRGVEPTEVHSLAFSYTRYKVGTQKGQRRLQQDCLGEGGKPALVLAKAPKKGEKRQYEPIVGIPPEVRDRVPLIYLGTDRSLRDQLPSGRYSLLRQLLEDIDRDLRDDENRVRVPRPDGTEVNVPRLQRFQELVHEAMEVLRTDSFARLESSIKRSALRQLGFDPETDTDRLDFFFGPFDTVDFYRALDIRLREDGFEMSATESGEGVQNAIVLAILQAFEERRKKGAILLIEEPEMFLHPQKQRSLYKTLREIGGMNQIIYTTHSPHFVTIPSYEEVLLVRRDAGGTSVRNSSLPPDAARREKLIKEFDPERNELFFASRLLLVEGDTEKLALPEYARRLGIDLDRAGATIVEVGGKQNLPEFVRVASSFGIPTGVLVDQDSGDFAGKREEERAFDERLEAMATEGSGVRVWKNDKDYEDVLRRALGEERYLRECQKHPNTGKPSRARRMAADPTLPIPDPLKVILGWLGGADRTG